MVKPGRQPRSSICPTIVLAHDKPLLVVGSPGASRIICTVAELIVDVIDYGLGADEANSTPRFYCEKSADYLHLEKGISPEVEKKLQNMGHVLRTYEALDLFFGGAQLILVDTLTGNYFGSADPRRGGVATGD
jgi:gamma-glutamyltranspeptidase / glutathione hydrolase